MSKTLREDKWAMKAIEYLVRMDFSSKEVIEAMVEVGIKHGIKPEDKKEYVNQS